MKCDLINRESIISRYLLNELSEDENLKFEEHYFKCGECFNELKAAEEALNLIKDEGPTLFQKTRKVKKERAKSFIDKILSGFVNPAKMGIAFTTIAVVFVLLYVFYNLSSNKTEPIIADDGRDSVKQMVEQKSLQPEDEPIPKQKEPELLASLTGPEFEPNAYYEEWINENVRSGGAIEKVIAPVNEKRFYGNITFKWIMKENIPVFLSILKNTEERIFSTEIHKDLFPEIVKTITSNNFKKSGLYYWRIEDESEVYYVGKFYFIKSQ